MSTAVLDRAILNTLEQRLGPERVAKVVAAQLNHGVELLKALSELELAPDRTRLRSIAHQIAGSSGSIGLTRLGAAAGALELAVSDMAEDGLAGAARELAVEMRTSFAELIQLYPQAAP